MSATTSRTTGVGSGSAGPASTGRLRFAFAAAIGALVVGFSASSSPVPLFNVYRSENGFSTNGVALATVAYFAGTITALLVLGRLADHVGRRPVAVAALVLLAAGCVVLLDVDAVGVLILGRLLMGLGAGLASSTLTSYIVDTAPPRPSWLASVASSQSPMLGLTVGAVGSGALVQYGPEPRALVYLVAAAALVCCAVMVLLSPETVGRTAGALRSLRPQVHLPRRTRHLVPVASAIFLATWATGAFYQAFVPALTADQLHTDNALVVEVIFAAYMAPSVLGAPVGGRLAPATAQRIGMLVHLVGMAGIVTALAAATLPLFVAASIVAGAGQGIAVSASIRNLLHGSSPADRSAIFAAIYLLSYSGAAVPSLISGRLSESFGLVQIALGYAALALIATGWTLIAAQNPDRGAEASAGS